MVPVGTHTRLSAGSELGTGAGSGEGQLSGHPGWELAVHTSPDMGGSKRPQLQCSLDSNHKINPNKPGVEGSHAGPDKLGRQKSEHWAMGTQTLGFTQQTNGMCPNQAMGPVFSGDFEASAPSARAPGLARSTGCTFSPTPALWAAAPTSSARGSAQTWTTSGMAFPGQCFPEERGTGGRGVFLESPQQEAGLGRQAVWTLPCVQHLSLLHWLIIATE